MRTGTAGLLPQIPLPGPGARRTARQVPMPRNAGTALFPTSRCNRGAR